MLRTGLIIGLIANFLQFNVDATTRIKDIVNFEGVRENTLVGYGLVVGLNGTGDNLRNSGFTQNTLINHLNKMGVSTTNINNNLNTRNVASVMVTGTLPAFAQPGSTISINVSTMGDAKSLKGGTLLATPLLGADGEVYGIAQGQISIGIPTTIDQRNNKPTPTAGHIPNGAIVEQAVGFDLNTLSQLRISLKNPDISTARMIATSINSQLRDSYARPLDPGTVLVRVPGFYQNDVVGLLSEIETLTIEPDTIAKIIIDEATGTVVIGDNVRISKVAVAQGNLVLKVSDTDRLKFFLDNDENDINVPGSKLATLESHATLADLVKGLNTLGVQPQDLIAILKTIQQAGALQASIEVK